MSGEYKIQLATGRTIYLRYLNQIRTYDFLLEGLPTREMNARIIKNSLSAAMYPNSSEEAYLAQPVETPMEYKEDKKYPFGTPASLPSIKCQAYFSSYDPVRDDTKDFSWLIIIWFQEEFGIADRPSSFRAFSFDGLGKYRARRRILMNRFNRKRFTYKGVEQ